MYVKINYATVLRFSLLVQMGREVLTPSGKKFAHSPLLNENLHVIN